MGEESEIGIASHEMPSTILAAHARNQDESPLHAVAELVKLAGSAYAIGFIVIMTHTARLHAPVVEALEFQNFVAGLPVWLPLCAGIWLLPRFGRRFRSPDHAGNTTLNITGLSILLGAILIGTVIAYAEIRWLVGRSFTLSENLVIISAVLFAMIVSIVVQILREKRTRSGPLAVLMGGICVYAGISLFAVAYAVYGYPNLPQTIGGGSPVQVRILFKESGMREVLEEAPVPANQNPPSDPVLLYYRTSSYLLVSAKEGRPLVQIPIEQIRAVVWVNSRAE